MKLRTLALSILFTMSLIGLFAQQGEVKQEFEKRIEPHQMPAAVFEQLDRLQGQWKAVRYYKEVSSGVVSYEIKFKWKGDVWSLEFDSVGVFIDLEKNISSRAFDRMMTETARQELKRIGSPYRILKVQQQFVWAQEHARPFDPAMVNAGCKGVIIRYEIELEVKTSAGTLATYELLMEANGTLLRKRPIVAYNDKHLVF